MKFSKKIVESLKSLLLAFSEVVTDKGILAWETEEELKEGDSVSVVLEDGTKAAAEDGEYTTEDNVVYVVSEGKVKEVKLPAEPQPETVEETTNETVEEVKESLEETSEEEISEEVKVIEEPESPAPEDTPEDKTNEVLDAIQALKETIDVLEERIAKLENKPAAAPVSEEFEAVKKQKSTGDKNLDFACKLASAARK